MEIGITRRALMLGALATIASPALGSEEAVTPLPDLTLHVSGSTRILHNFGEFTLDLTVPDSLFFNRKHGDLTNSHLDEVRDDTWNRNTLYRCVGEPGTYYFRYAGDAYDPQGNRTGFWGMTWGNGKVAPAGSYQISSVKDMGGFVRKPNELCTIGDSLTHFSFGEMFRAYLAAYMPNYSFIGSKTDVYGYGHEGKGGNTTQEIWDRLETIGPSKEYFLWAGTNDALVDMKQTETFANFRRIAETLQKRGSIVHVGTILPTTKWFDGRNKHVSDMLREWIASADPQSIRLVEVDQKFRETENWQSLLFDGIHPTQQGYAVLTKIIAPQILGVRRN